MLPQWKGIKEVERVGRCIDFAMVRRMWQGHFVVGRVVGWVEFVCLGRGKGSGEDDVVAGWAIVRWSHRG